MGPITMTIRLKVNSIETGPASRFCFYHKTRMNANFSAL